MNSKRNFIAFLLSVSAAVLVLLPASAFALTDLEKCQNERTALQIELQRYKAIEAEMKEKIAEVEAQGAQQKAEFDAKSAELDKLLADKQAEIDKLTKENETLKTQLAAANEKAAAAAKTAVEQKNADAQRLKEMQVRVVELEKQLTAAGGSGLQTKDSTQTEQSDSSLSNKEKIAELEATIADLTEQLNECKDRVRRQQERIERLAAQREELKKELDGEIKDGDLNMPDSKGRIVININERISFDSGSVELKRNVRPALDKIAKSLKNYPEHKIIIEGHTDTDPIKKGSYSSNKELSEVRADAVLQYLLENTGLDKSRFKTVGRGDTKPIARNNTAANKALNRRVDIIVIPAADDAEAGSNVEFED